MSSMSKLRQVMSSIGKLGTLLILISMFLLTSVAFAGMGVFNPQITPNEFPINVTTNVKVTAEVGTDANYPLIGTSVVLYETDATGKPIKSMGTMYDDGAHGDAKASDTIFTNQFTITQANRTKKYYQVSVAYKGVRSRYLSPVIQLEIFEPLPVATLEDASSVFNTLQADFYNYIKTMDLTSARQLVLQDAKTNSNITTAEINGSILFVIYKGRVHGSISIADPNNPTDGAGRSLPNNLPTNYKTPGNDKILIYAPGYNDSSPQKGIADHAASQFFDTEYMTFPPYPLNITQDANASLELVKHWGDYGTVVIHTHGLPPTNSNNNRVGLLSGIPANTSTLTTYKDDFSVDPPRLWQSTSGKIGFYPEFITQHSVSMKDTFLYLGACDSMKNDTMWNALLAKGAKVAFGWSETVDRQFNTDTFSRLIDPLLPHSNTHDPQTAKQAFDNVTPKIDSTGGYNATLTMKTASSEWDNFTYVDGSIINGDFETGDWTGWTYGADPGNAFGYVAGANVHGGRRAAVLGRWNFAYTGQSYIPGVEPTGNEWFYQDFVVPSNASKLSLWWFMETYDTAEWDWFDAKIQNPATGVDLKSIIYHGGKPGTNYGPYWNSGSWQFKETDITAYRGQKIRIHFSQTLDGWGDQTRTFIDDVKIN